jgi:hypothetical protein
MSIPLQAPEQFRWHFAPEVSEALRQSLADGRWTAAAEVLKQNRRRAVYRVPGTPGLIIKHDRPPRLIDWVKTAWRHPGQREYAAGRLSQARGLPVPTPLGFARRGAETLFAAVELAGCETLWQAWRRAQSDPAWRVRLLAGLAIFARTFAAARVKHPDLHSGNILVRDRGGAGECSLVDLAGARPLSAGARFVAWDAVGWITQLAPAIEPQEARALLAAAGVLPASAEPLALWWTLLRRAGRNAARRWPGRRVRLLQTSSLCETVAVAEGVWRLAPPFRLETAQAACRQHEANLAAGRLAQGDRARRWSRVTVDGRALLVTEFLAPGCGPWRSDRRTWLNHCRLGPGGFRVCRCHAWLQGRRRGVLILEDLGGSTLDEALRTPLPADRRGLLASTMELLATLHAVGTVPGETTTRDVAVCGPGAGGTPVRLATAEVVRFGVNLSVADRADSLGQFLATLPDEVTRRERLRAVVVYRRAAGLGRAELRRLLARLAPAASP